MKEVFKNNKNIIIIVVIVLLVIGLVISFNSEKVKLNGKTKNTEYKNEGPFLGDSNYIYNSSDVYYDNTTSGLTSDRVKGAIDELYQKCSTPLSTCRSSLSTCQSDLEGTQSNYSTCQSSLTTAQSNYSTCSTSLSTCQTQLANAPIAKNNTVYYAFGTPTTSSTTDYTTLNKRVFVGLNGSQKSVCIIRNSKLHCFDNNNYPIEKDHVQQVFNDISCDVGSSSVVCYASDFRCNVNSNGYVRCYANSPYERCYVDGDGSVNCTL